MKFSYLPMYLRYSKPVYNFFEREIFCTFVYYNAQKILMSSEQCVGPDQTACYAPFDRVHTGRIRTTIDVSSGLRFKI